MKGTSKLVVSLTLPAMVALVTACGQSGMQTGGNAPQQDAQQIAGEQRTWEVLTTQADKCLQDGDKAAAEKLYKDAWVEAKRMGEESLDAGRSASNLANFYYVQGDGQQADSLFQNAIAIKEKTLGAEHEDLVKDLVGLGKVYATESKYAEADAMYQRAIQIEKKAGKDTSDIEKEVAAIQGKIKS